MTVSEEYHWKNRQILIVDDDDSSSFLLGEILKRTGAELSYVDTGNAAVDFIKDHPLTDLVLMDIQLPDKDGLTATREIKEINGKIHVITQSAYLNFASETGKKGGADAFVSKPINPKILLSKIGNLLD